MNTHLTFQVYGYDGCTFCDKAKELLKQENLSYIFLPVGDTVEQRRAWLDRRCYTDPAQRTFPRIFMRDRITNRTLEVGGYTELENWVLSQ